MGHLTFTGIRQLIIVLFITVIFLGLTIGRQYPIATKFIAIGLILVGVLIFLYAINTLPKFNDVFDYEPTTFRGKQSNGKETREILMALNIIGLWCALAGITLLLIV